MGEMIGKKVEEREEKKKNTDVRREAKKAKKEDAQ